MKLAAYSNYALRSSELDRVESVVRVHGLAWPCIVKIVRGFGQVGLVEKRRGRGGRFRLIEEPLVVVECFNLERNISPLIGVLSRVLREAASAFMAVLDDLALADVAASKSGLFARIAPIENGIVAPMWWER